MRKKDFVKLNKKMEKRILKENREFYDELVRENFGKKKAAKKATVAATETCGASGEKTKPHKLVLTSAIAVFLSASLVGATCIATGFFGLFTPPHTAEPPAFVGYKDADRMQESIELSDVVCPPVTLTAPPADAFDLNVIRSYDKVWNDTLYYRISLESSVTIESLYLTLYPNEMYEGAQSVETPQDSRTSGGVAYDYRCVSEETDGIYSFAYEASAALDGLKIYVTYDELTLSDTSNFFALLGSVVIIAA